MYSKEIGPKLDQMFAILREKAEDIIDSSPSFRDASERIADLVGSETAIRSKSMFTDMYDVLSDRVLDELGDVSRQNRFFEANLRKEIMEKFNFSAPGDIDFQEANRVYTSLAAGAGTALVGGVLVYALSPAAPAIPIAVVIAAAVGAYCATYYKISPELNKRKFTAAVHQYLLEVKESFMAWLDEIERYFHMRAEEICRSLQQTR